MQKTEVKLLDDLARYETDDDVLADETVHFGLDGKEFEIDLNKDNAGALRNVLAPFVAVARRAQTRKPPTRSADRIKRELSSKQRDWARSRGMDVSDRGRIPEEVSRAYFAAHPSETAGQA
jgi:hypothetical protein